MPKESMENTDSRQSARQLARQLRRMGVTVDMERVAPQWSKRYRDASGTEKITVARIDLVATIPGSNELQWLDVTIRRPTALTNMEGAARMGGHAATQGEKEKTKKYGNRDEIGPDTVRPISLELGGRLGPQTTTVLRGLTTKLAATGTRASMRGAGGPAQA